MSDPAHSPYPGNGSMLVLAGVATVVAVRSAVLAWRYSPGDARANLWRAAVLAMFGAGYLLWIVWLA